MRKASQVLKQSGVKVSKALGEINRAQNILPTGHRLLAGQLLAAETILISVLASLDRESLSAVAHELANHLELDAEPVPLASLPKQIKAYVNERRKDKR